MINWANAGFLSNYLILILFEIFAQDFSVLRLRGALPLQEAPGLAAIKACGKWWSSDPQQADL